MRTHIKMEEIVPGVPPTGAKIVFFLSRNRRGLSVTYPAPISTVFATQCMYTPRLVLIAQVVFLLERGHIDMQTRPTNCRNLSLTAHLLPA